MKNIVYDVDDVLNNLNGVVYSSLGILHLYKIQKRFRATENLGTLDEKTVAAIIEKYEDPKVFEQLSPVKGIERILDVEKIDTDAAVHIHSLNFKEQIAFIKRAFLTENVPNIKESNINLVVGTHKEPFANAFSITEDSLENLLLYEPCVHRILIDKPYNQFESYGINNKEVGILRVDCLDTAVDMVEFLIRQSR